MAKSLLPPLGIDRKSLLKMKKTFLLLGLLSCGVAFAQETYQSSLGRAVTKYGGAEFVPVESIRWMANEYDRTFSQVFRDLRSQEVGAQASSVLANVSTVVPAPAPAPAAAPAPMAPSYSDPLLPPNAQPGHCYARVLVPIRYRTETRQVLRAQGAEKISVRPAAYKTMKKQVLVQEATTRYETVPPVYGWIEERVMVRPPSSKLMTVPATYKTVTERVLDVPEHTVWKRGAGPLERIDSMTGEIMCLVTVPATYKTISKKVLVTPATVKEVQIPAEYKMVKRKVVKQEGKVVPVEVPAEYKTVEVTEMVAPPTFERTVAPDEYQTVSTKVLESPAHLEWREILCETNITPRVISRLQQALTKEGYDPGAADGKFGAKTQAAVRSFQKDNNLATGALTFRTLEALGLYVGSTQMD